MKNYMILILISLFLSCNSKVITTDEKKDEQTELFVREPLKNILDSLIAIDIDKGAIQELCIPRSRRRPV